MGSTCITTREALRGLAGSDLPDWAALERAARPKRLRPGESLFLAGQERPHVFVVNEGVLKMVYETRRGDAWVKDFAEPGVCFASLSALEQDGLTSFSVYAEVASRVEQIDYRTLVRLADAHIEWQRAMTNALKLYGQRKERREMELLTLSPEERYRTFMRDRPELVAVIRQRDIASYIRVTPVALSRIKSRLARRAPASLEGPDGPAD